MARPASNHQKTRLSLDVTIAVRDRLERLREATQADSLTEVFRRALALYELLGQQTSGGAKIILRQPDGVEREVLMF